VPAPARISKGSGPACAASRCLGFSRSNGALVVVVTDATIG
jgi:hypothetical protein